LQIRTVNLADTKLCGLNLHFHYKNIIAKLEKIVEFWILTAVIKNSAVVWLVTPRSLERSRRFGGTYVSHLQGRSVIQVRNQYKRAES
jgi:hypothetical protein